MFVYSDKLSDGVKAVNCLSDHPPFHEPFVSQANLSIRSVLPETLVGVRFQEQPMVAS